MKRFLKITLLVIVYLLAFSAGVEAYTANFSGTPTTVKSGETFTVKVTVDESTTLANSHITYDKSLFEFVGATQTNLSASVYAPKGEGEVAWMYTDMDVNSKGVKTFEMKFKAKNVTEDKTGVFKMSDATFITVGQQTYEGTNVKGDKNIAVTVKAGSSSNSVSSRDEASRNNTTTPTNGSTTNKTSGSTTNKTSTTTYNSGLSSTNKTSASSSTNNTTKDTTTTEKSNLPKTGDKGYVALIAGTVFIVLAVIYKRKEKNLF